MSTQNGSGNSSKHWKSSPRQHKILPPWDDKMELAWDGGFGEVAE